MNNAVIRAAGGVVWRQADGQASESSVEIALIHRPRYDDWSIPKGKLAPGESEIEGALREVFEETGYRVRLGRPLGKVNYLKASAGGKTRPKIVRYWAMQVESGAFSPNREVDELRWVTLDQAQDLLTHDHDKDVLQRFCQGPIFTGSVLLVRHALAGNRASWTGNDKERPLDEGGWEQAQELVRLLSRFDVQQIVSADYARCVQTVEPLAEAIGLNIKEEALFSEDGFPGSEDEAVALLRDFGASSDTTVICSQGDVIPELLDRLTAEDHVDLPEQGTKKAGTWALNFEGRRLFSAEYFPPPARPPTEEAT